MNPAYLVDRVRRFNLLPNDTSMAHDELLYRIGTHVDALDVEDCDEINKLNGWLQPQHRYNVLNWLLTNGYEIKGDLTLLIFGSQQLENWLERSEQAYPHFEFYLCFEYQVKFKSGFDDGINYTMYWHPKVGAPAPLSEHEIDFPWRSFWDNGEMFWSDCFPGGAKNDFDFTLNCYPDEQSFTKPGVFCKEGDWYTMTDERDARLLSVSQIIESLKAAA